MTDFFTALLTFLLPAWMVTPELINVVVIVAGIVLIVFPLIIAVAMLTWLERKVIGYMHVRIGPNRVGPRGLLQPFADTFKLLLKEIVVPAGADKLLFLIAPIVSVAAAFAAWAVVPFDGTMVLANVNAGLLYILAITSLGVYGVIIAGWASNSKYAFLGAMRSAAQIVSYEIAMGFALVGVLMAAGSMNLGEIVNAQNGSWARWFMWPLFPLFVIYFISAVAETNRAPFDVAEGESEIVAGFHVEYSGAAFACFFLAEYANMMLVSLLAAVMFMGGWLSPLQGTMFESIPMLGANGMHWLFAKVFFFLILFLWFRATFPRYRYDQIMRLGWKVFIPLTIVWLVVVGVWIMAGVFPFERV